MKLTLRSWQARFMGQLARHRRDDFLLVACPAAGKTIAAGAGAAQVMGSRGCDQLVVVCPTLVVRDQWQAELDEQLGFRMQTTLERGGWPAHVHGVCVTYAQVALRVGAFAGACEGRRTVAIFDEVHHAGEQLAWGAAVARAFAGARFRLSLSGTPFRSDRDQIPFVRYDDAGRCLPDFAYDYPRAVRDGVCRPIEFRTHDGEITWSQDGTPRTAAFSDKVDEPTRARRLRASLDPSKAYLRSVLQSAHSDLQEMRERAPDAAGLIVCDSQAHALEVDRLVSEVVGELPIIAISDIPGAHKAIRAFATDTTEWLVSVRMVAEGVDIPRLGVVVWATAAHTELMVRQVAGRALRGRGDHTALPAVVHLPADPQLISYAARLDVLAGVSPRSRTHDRESPAEAHHRCARGRSHTTAIDATPLAGGESIAPQIPVNAGRGRGAPEALEVATPALPPSPQDIKAAEQTRLRSRADLLQLLNVYAQLRRRVEPAYHLGSAQSELTAAVGPVGPDAPSEVVDGALAWIRGRTNHLAGANPGHVVDLARERRRLSIAAEAV